MAFIIPTVSKAPPRLITFDEDGDTLIILPYTAQTTANQDAASGETPDASGPVPSIFTFGDHKSKTSLRYGEAEETLVDSPVETNELHMKVSKKHLMLASRRARTVLSGPWKESGKKTTDGLHHWSFEPIFTPESFEIVMNIIHGHTKMISHEVTLRTLADVAAVVDDLQCEDAVWFAAKSWIRLLENKSHPIVVNDDLVRWIMVATVFDEPAIFQRCTKVAILHGDKPLNTLGLPIRPPIIGKAAIICYHCRNIYSSELIREDKVESQRKKTLDAIMVEVKAKQNSLISGISFCSFECRSSLLGALMQGLNSTGLSPVWPPVLRQEMLHHHHRTSVSSAIGSILSIPSPVTYSPGSDVGLMDGKQFWRIEHKVQPKKKKMTQAKTVGMFRSPADSKTEVEEQQPPTFLTVHDCSLKAHLEPQLAALESGIMGLTLKDFVRK